MAAKLKVKNWEKHQHYKDRNPPWIKLHGELLADDAFVCLPDKSKLHLILIWLLARRTNGVIPNNPIWIKKAAGLDDDVDIEPLISAGFLCAFQDDIKLRATCAQLDDKVSSTCPPETETETEGIGIGGGDCENPFTTPTDTPEQINPIARYPATVQEQARRILSGWHFWRYGSLPNLSSDSTIGNLNTIAATVEAFGDSVEAKMAEFMQKPPPGFPRTAPLFRIFKHLGLEAPNHEPVQPPRRTNHAGRGSPMSAGGGRYEGIKPVIAD